LVLLGAFVEKLVAYKKNYGPMANNKFKKE